MMKIRAKIPAHLKKRNDIQKAYVGNNNRAKPTTAKTPRKNSARGTRRSQKSIDQDKKIDQTIVDIGEAINKLDSQLSEFVTKNDMNNRLSELRNEIFNFIGEKESWHLNGQLNAIQQPRKPFQRQASEDSGFSFNTADLFQTPPQTQNKKSSAKK